MTDNDEFEDRVSTSLGNSLGTEDTTEQDILEEYDEGATQRELAEKYDCNIGAIQYRLAKHAHTAREQSNEEKELDPTIRS